MKRLAVRVWRFVFGRDHQADWDARGPLLR